MRFLVDEDVDSRVGAFLRARKHDVRYARDEFGPQTKDANNVAWARSQATVLITGDRALAGPLRNSRKCACLFLKDLSTHELERVRALLPVIEAEHAISGDAFWMQISRELYIVAR